MVICAAILVSMASAFVVSAPPSRPPLPFPPPRRPPFPLARQKIAGGGRGGRWRRKGWLGGGREQVKRQTVLPSRPRSDTMRTEADADADRKKQAKQGRRGSTCIHGTKRQWRDCFSELEVAAQCSPRDRSSCPCWRCRWQPYGGRAAIVTTQRKSDVHPCRKARRSSPSSRTHMR
eukprot:1659516-Rhodomonas_salina.3